MNRASPLLVALVLGAFVPRARAQSFNMDMGSSTHPVPSSTFGGGANQPGFWNSVNETSTPPFQSTLLDLNGQATSVTVAVTRQYPGGQPIVPVVYPDEPGFSTDQAALYGDSLLWVTSVQSTITVSVSGLVPGAYDFICYAGNRFSEGSFYVLEAGFNLACMYLDGTFSEYSVWRQRCWASSTGNVTLIVGTCGSPLSDPAINALQIVRRAFSCSETNETFCSGVAVGSACNCPCGNCGLANRGCDNSFATGGGQLLATGNASVAADSLVLRAEFLPPTSSALFYQGTGVVNGGFGATYGDGLRCVGGSAIRLGNRFATGGIVNFGAGQGSDPLVSVRGLLPPSGGTRYYQVWYRNAPTYCTASTVNLTNGFRVIWVP